MNAWERREREPQSLEGKKDADLNKGMDGEENVVYGP